jgi:hypothetical protein
MPADKEALAKRYSYSSITRNDPYPLLYLALLIHTKEYGSPDTNPRIVHVAVDKASPIAALLFVFGCHPSNHSVTPNEKCLTTIIEAFVLYSTSA